MKIKPVLIFVILVICSSFASADITVDNLGWWSLQTSLTNGLLDQSPNGNNATNFGTTYNSSADAFDFDGSTSYIDSSLNYFSGDKTISFWFNPSFTFPIGGGQREVLIGSSWGVDIQFLGSESTNKLNVRTFVNNGGATRNILSTKTDWVSDTWYKIDIVLNDTDDTGRIYIDGVLDNTGSVYISTETNDIRIGGTSDTLLGKMSTVSIWNRTLSSTEISDLYAQGRSYNPYFDEYLILKARDSKNLSLINTFNATVNGFNYSTTTGEIEVYWKINNPLSLWYLKDSNYNGLVNETNGIVDSTGINNGTLYGKTFNHGTNNGAELHNNLTGTITGATWEYDAELGRDVLSFDGDGDYVTVDGKSLNVNEGTICGNFETNTLDTSSQYVSNAYIFAHYNSGNRLYLYQVDSSLRAAVGTTTNILFNENLELNHNYEVCLSYNEGTVDLYVDGDLDKTTTYTGLTEVKDNFELGKDDTATRAYFNGTISDVIILDKALNSTEVQQLYETGNINTTGYYHEINFPLDEGTGTEVYTKEGKFGGYYDFDGSNDVINMNAPIPSVETNTFSSCVWVYNNPFNSVNFQGIIGFFNDWTIERQTQNEYRVYINGSGLISINTVEENVWQHICLVLENNEISFYTNGNKFGTTTAYTGKVPINNNFQIGRQMTSGTRYFNGSIDEVKIWNRALSETEIQEEMSSNAVANPEGIVAYYDFNERTGDTVYDNNHLTTGARQNVNTIEDLVFSWDKGMNFDGVDDYIDFTGLTSDNSYTLTGWFNTNDNGYIFDSQTGRSLVEINTNKIRFWQSSTQNEFFGNINFGEWYFYSVVANEDNVTLYLNGVNTANDIFTINSVGGNVILGSRYSKDSGFFNGSIADVRIYDRALSEFEIQNIYEGNPQKFNITLEAENYQPYTNETVPLTTNTLTSDLTPNFKVYAYDIYTNETINTFNATVEGIKYITNNGEIITTESVDKTSLDVTLEAENYQTKIYLGYNALANGNLNSSLISNPLEDFTLINPNNTKSNNTIYDVIYTQAVSPTSKTVTYNISVYYENGTLKESYETTNLIYELNLTDYNANIYNISVNAEENLTGNNYTHSSLLYVDRTNYIYFQDATNFSALVGSNVTLTLPNSTQEFYTTDSQGKINFQSFRGFDLINGTHLITYEGVQGYISPISFTYNATTLPYNLTYNISRTNITLNFYDRETGNLITENVTFSIEGLLTNSTTTGTYSIDDVSISAGTYNLYASTPGYDIEYKAFTYTSQDNLDLSLFLVNSTSDNIITAITRVYDLGYNLLPGADVRLQEYDADTKSFSEVSQCFSDSNGECVFQVEKGIKIYKVVVFATINGVTYTEQSSETGSSILLDQTIYELYLGAGNIFEVSDLYDLSAYLTNTQLSSGNVSTANGVFVDGAGLTHEVCLAYYYMEGLNKKLWFDPICEVASSGELSVTGGYFLDRSFTNIIDIYVNDSGNIIVYDTVTYESTESIAERLGSFLKPVFVFIMSVILALMMYFRKVHVFSIGMIILIFFSITFTPTLITGFISSGAIVSCLFIMFLAKKESDNDAV